MFYGIKRMNQLSVLPPILGSIEAWRAVDNGRRITFVRSRPDIIAEHLGGATYFSNVPQLAADLDDIAATPRERHELELLEIRHVENDRIPFGIFEPVDGWPLRDLIGFVRCATPLAAAITLQIYRSYSSAAPNVVTPDGQLVCKVLPHFSRIWRSEVPSFIGTEPDISIRGRISEGRELLASLCKTVTTGDDDDDTETAGEAFEAELLRLGADCDAGPQLAKLLATSWSMTSPW